MSGKKFICFAVLVVSSLSQLRPNPFSEDIFALTFNASPPPPAPAPTIFSSISSQSSQRAAPLAPGVQALNQIKQLAAPGGLPTKVIQASVGKKIYMIFKAQDGIYRYEVAEPALIARLFGDRSFLQVSSQLLDSIPLDSKLDKYAQLIRAKGETDVYLAREAGRYLVSSDQMQEYGFSASNVVQVQPCFMQLFTNMYPLV